MVCKVFGQYELVGLSSWTDVGCATLRPFAATSIGYFRDWIRKNAGI